MLSGRWIDVTSTKQSQFYNNTFYNNILITSTLCGQNPALFFILTQKPQFLYTDLQQMRPLCFSGKSLAEK